MDNEEFISHFEKPQQEWLRMAIGHGLIEVNDEGVVRVLDAGWELILGITVPVNDLDPAEWTRPWIATCASYMGGELVLVVEAVHNLEAINFVLEYPDAAPQEVNV